MPFTELSDQLRFILTQKLLNEKTDTAEHLKAFHRIGLLTNEHLGKSRAALYSVFRHQREDESGTQSTLQTRCYTIQIK